MPRETEIKLRLDSPKTFLRALKRLGAKPSAPRIHDLNFILVTPDGCLAKDGQVVRFRSVCDARVSSVARSCSGEV